MRNSSVVNYKVITYSTEYVEKFINHFTSQIPTIGKRFMFLLAEKVSPPLNSFTAKIAGKVAEGCSAPLMRVMKKRHEGMPEAFQRI